MMKTHYIEIPNSDWGILFIYDFDLMDSDEIAAIMNSFGLDEYRIKKSIRILMGLNTGMTISREDLHMSVIFVGKQTSMEQFADTVSHEALHAANAILSYYGIPCDNEDESWTLGYIVRQIARAVKEDMIYGE